MNATIVRTQDIPALGHDEAMTLARTEYERMNDVLNALSTDDWERPTDCTRWTVKGIVAHLVGMADAMVSMREMFRQQRASRPVAKAEGLNAFDGLTEYQAQTKATLGPRGLTEAFAAKAPKVLEVRSRTTPLRLLRFPSPPYGWFSLGYLRDDILTRDVWMHRIDICRATGRQPVLTSEHDGRFVANIVRELAARWKQPFTLELTGPAGGTYVNGSGGLSATLDAVEFCRIMSGRAAGHGLPTDVVPF